MSRTKLEIQTDIDTINAALQELISGRRLTELRLGSGEFVRYYKYQELTYENLIAEKNKLIQELSEVTGEAGLTFRKQTHVQLQVSKFLR